MGWQRNEIMKDLLYDPCVVCNEREGCKVECKVFIKYTRTISLKDREDNLKLFLLAQSFA